MKVQLKSLSEQVIVITGATSGIGLSTARHAASRGAKLVLVARNDEALELLAAELNRPEHRAIAVQADVGKSTDIENVFTRAIDEFGGFDTWVNNAGVSIYGKTEDVPLEDMRQLFETNFWGVVYGSLAALRYLKAHGGAIINVGSVVSDRALPIQGIYSASKHAVKAFTDGLRMEIEHDGYPVSVSLIKPGAIDTPYTDHARSYLGVEPKNPPPLYSPDLVAEAILHCAQYVRRDVIVGGGGKAISSSETFPRLADKLMEATLFKGQRSDRPLVNRNDNLYTPGDDLHERSMTGPRGRERSFYTFATLYPGTTGALAAGAGIAMAALVKGAFAANGSTRASNLK